MAVCKEIKSFSRTHERIADLFSLLAVTSMVALSSCGNGTDPPTPVSGNIDLTLTGDSITGGNPIAIVAGTKTQNTLTGWTTQVSSGNILWFNVNSATTIVKATVSLGMRRTLF